MEYVAILRARRVLIWYVLCALALEALILIFIQQLGHGLQHSPHGAHGSSVHTVASGGATHAHGVVHVQPHSGLHFGRGMTLSDVFLMTSYGPLLLAPFLALGLDAEYRTAAIAWTRPLSRFAIAGRYLAVDALALLVGWLVAVVLVFVMLLLYSDPHAVIIDGGIAATLVIGSAAPVLWYGLIVLVSALLPGRGSAVMGAAWAAFFVVGFIAGLDLPPAAHALAALLNQLNPFHYLGLYLSGHGPGPLQQASLAWLLGALAIAAGTRVWATRDLPV